MHRFYYAGYVESRRCHPCLDGRRRRSFGSRCSVASSLWGDVDESGGARTSSGTGEVSNDLLGGRHPDTPDYQRECLFDRRQRGRRGARQPGRFPKPSSGVTGAVDVVVDVVVVE